MLLIVLITILITFSLVAFGIYKNNIETIYPSNHKLHNSLNLAITWLEDNQESLHKNHNSALWWMLKEASQQSNNNQLKSFYLKYKKSYLDIRPRNVWSPYFYDNYTPTIDHITDLYPLREYQLFFIYTLSCSSNMENEPVIKKQLKSDYCNNHFLQPRCVTHQQMAVRFLNKKQCGDYRELSNELLEIIEQEIAIDFRVTDSYLQRALMLADAKIPLKPVWVSKIIHAQQQDGGWADFYPLISLGKTQLGTTSTGLSKGPKKSSFHATAQSIWLLTLLINQTSGNEYAFKK